MRIPDRDCKSVNAFCRLLAGFKIRGRFVTKRLRTPMPLNNAGLTPLTMDESGFV
jgi:hypothetical protein